MSYLVDTDWVIAYLKARADAIQLLDSLAGKGISISLITKGEVYEGIYYGRDPVAAELGFRLLLRVVNVLPLNRAIMQRFARLRGQLRSQGQIIGDSDIMIAATALHHDLTLLTRNLRHFQRITSLQIYQS